MDTVEQTDTAFINTRLRTTIQHCTSVRLQILRYRPYYARSIVSIMPGQTWRDNGHKGLMPIVTCSGCLSLASAQVGVSVCAEFSSD